MADWRYFVFMSSHKYSRKISTPLFKSTRLLDQLREQIRDLHYSLRTEAAYVLGEKVQLFSSQAASTRLERAQRAIGEKFMPIPATSPYKIYVVCYLFHSETARQPT
jgi:hypothetical protein